MDNPTISSFQTGGALLGDSPVYIEREADREALRQLQAMNYLLVIEPRQQGKTSLVNHLMCNPALVGTLLVYIDITTLDRSSEMNWYQTLCPRILRQLRHFIPRKQWPDIPENSARWRDFLWDIAAFATDAQKRIVIALDEIGAVTFPGVTRFFSVLRDVYNSRQAEAEFKQLTFLLTGAFHPRDLIEDEKISPFNIAQRVRLPDFTLEQIRELTSKGGWKDQQASELARRIHYWIDGQPYLTQLLCSYLNLDATSADVDAGVERLRRDDENHLPPLLEQLENDDLLHKYVENILSGKAIKFSPKLNSRHAKLELLGVIKANEEGYCVIRNRIYERLLKKPVQGHYYGTGNRWAVLIGVNQYEDKNNYGQLHVCVKDVEIIREQLVASGFDPNRVRLLTDNTPDELPTRGNILAALKSIADATEPDDLLLFYYSGHGDEDNGESYLVARNGRRVVLKDTAVPVSLVKEYVEAAPAHAKVIVLDACHSGADIGKKGAKPMSEAFIRRVFEEAEGLAILASCKQEQVSYEWRENERSVFTHFLLEALAGQADWGDKGFVTVQDTNRYVTDGVKLWASQRNLRQTPTLQYAVSGDIILSNYAK